MLEDLVSPPICHSPANMLENSVNTWNLLWPSRLLIILAEPKTFTKALFLIL